MPPGNSQAFRASTTEAQMLKTLKDYARSQGGFCFHVRDSRGQDVVGLPDTILLLPRGQNHPGMVAFFELKTQHDTVSVAQRHVLAVLDQASEVVSAIIRPVPHGTLEISLDDALELLGY